MVWREVVVEWSVKKALLSLCFRLLEVRVKKLLEMVGGSVVKKWLWISWVEEVMDDG